MQIYGVTGWALRLATTALVATAITSFAIAEDFPDQKRQNLVELAISPHKFGGQTKRVFCPVSVAETDFLHCHVLNSRLQIIGTAIVHVVPDNPKIYADILDRCGGEYQEDVSVECTVEADIWVQPDYHYLEARRFYLTR